MNFGIGYKKDLEGILELSKQLGNNVSSIEEANKIKQILFDLGADICGIASIDRFTESPEGFNPIDTLPSCKSVVVFGKKFLKSTLDCNNAIPYTIHTKEGEGFYFKCYKCRTICPKMFIYNIYFLVYSN